MATQTMTTVQSQTIQNAQLLHLVGSKAIAAPPLKRSSSFGPYYSANRERAIPVVDSFDAPSDSSVWTKQPPNTSTSKIRQWVERRYYQYEVTWGLYVLTPGKKVVIKGLVLIMLSLIAYTITNIAIFEQGVNMIMHSVSALVGTTYSTLRPLCDCIVYYALGMGFELKDFGGFEDTVTLFKLLNMVVSGKS